MAPRGHAFIYTAIWNDPDYRNLTFLEQWMYEHLLSQEDLSRAGHIALRPRRWANAARDMTEDQITTALYGLAAARYVLIDVDAMELLIRTFVYHDKIWKQPKMMGTAAVDAALISSPQLRNALAIEMGRIPLDELSDTPTRDAKGNPVPSPRAQVAGHIATICRLAHPDGDGPGRRPPRPGPPADGDRDGRPHPPAEGPAQGARPPAHPPAEGAADPPPHPPAEGPPAETDAAPAPDGPHGQHAENPQVTGPADPPAEGGPEGGPQALSRAHVRAGTRAAPIPFPHTPVERVPEVTHHAPAREDRLSLRQRGWEPSAWACAEAAPDIARLGPAAVAAATTKFTGNPDRRWLADADADDAWVTWLSYERPDDPGEQPTPQADAYRDQMAAIERRIADDNAREDQADDEPRRPRLHAVGDAGPPAEWHAMRAQLRHHNTA
ncbi:hypothetical protein OG216_25855 [Streptomycetaceae bacterium NBC_01309]